MEVQMMYEAYYKQLLHLRWTAADTFSAKDDEKTALHKICIHLSRSTVTRGLEAPDTASVYEDFSF